MITDNKMKDYLISLQPLTYGYYANRDRILGLTEPDLGNVPKAMLKPLDYTQAMDWQAALSVIDHLELRSYKLSDPGWLALTGGTGLGKTRIAVACGILLDGGGAIDSEVDTPRYLLGRKLEQEAKDWRNGKPTRLTGIDWEPENSYEPVSFFEPLIIDDFGLINFTKSVVDALYEIIIESDHNNRPLILTTQIWGSALYNAMLGKNPEPQQIAKVDAIMRRLNEHCQVFHFSGPRNVDWQTLAKEREKTDLMKTICDNEMFYLEGYMDKQNYERLAKSYKQQLEELSTQLQNNKPKGNS
jgi:hypothetical protein